MLWEAFTIVREICGLLRSHGQIGNHQQRTDSRRTENKTRCKTWDSNTHLRLPLLLSLSLAAASALLDCCLLFDNESQEGGWQSWVHRDDLVRLICFCIEHPIAGAVNGTAPQPERFVDLMRQLANRLHRPLLLRVPAPVLLWSLGDMAKELLLASQHVSPRKIQEHGFVFCYPQLDQALAQIL